MSSKIIKLADNNDITLIPVTDASVVQMSVEGQVKSVKDVIIENEEVTAAGYNDLNSRVNALEERPGIDKVGTITDVRVNSSTVVSNGVANIPKADINGWCDPCIVCRWQSGNEYKEQRTQTLKNEVNSTFMYSFETINISEDGILFIPQYVRKIYQSADSQDCCGRTEEEVVDGKGRLR